MLTVRQVCERTRLSLSTIRRALRAGDLPHNRIGRSIRVSEADLRRFLSRSRSEPGK
jgi:excisionase family DNA binding protein